MDVSFLLEKVGRPQGTVRLAGPWRVMAVSASVQCKKLSGIDLIPPRSIPPPPVVLGPDRRLHLHPDVVQDPRRLKGVRHSDERNAFNRRFLDLRENSSDLPRPVGMKDVMVVEDTDCHLVFLVEFDS